ncbi:zincin-like metallopeptidase domain-containing protein [Pseudorhodoferax sp. LjRoot39]|uniref:ArdC family protein n=1 Tax=Pseudorhodoferax sp. LjRoot39 TaxID=3342328 RepID=UPI003ECDC8AA
MKASSKTQAPKTDVYARVTDKIVADLERGVRTWMRPWTVSGNPDPMGRPLRHNGTPYRGINVVLLWSDAIDKGFRSPTWMTYKQAQEFGGQVRKGESGSSVVYADRYTKTETNAQGEEAERAIAFMKGYTVFNADQIDGLPARYQLTPSPALPAMPLIDAAEIFFAKTGAVVRHGGGHAFFSPAADLIQLPEPGAFRDPESYAATKAHELIHWTGHESREARTFGKRFGDEAYAFEELVAEMGAAFLCADLGIALEVREDHAAYLAHWLQVLKQDRRAIFTAAAHAQRAADFLQSLQAG